VNEAKRQQSGQPEEEKMQHEEPMGGDARRATYGGMVS